jgi:hypothetical protein
MTPKQAIVAELGNDEILAPERIARALIANDQVKYYFALLQTACTNADHPRVPPPDLRVERLASRLNEEWLDDVVAGTRRDSAGAYRVPHGPEILRRIAGCVDTMLACLPPPEAALLHARLSIMTPVALDQGVSRYLVHDGAANGGIMVDCMAPLAEPVGTATEGATARNGQSRSRP